MLQASILIAGLALWCAGASLKRHRALRRWVSPAMLTMGGYAIVLGVALCFRAALSA
jgi:hypothetical protein